MLVDCWATTDIVNDKSKFDKRFESKNHYNELADGNKTNGIILGRGDAEVVLHDENGRCFVCTYIYTRHIFCECSNTKKGHL